MHQEKNLMVLFEILVDLLAIKKAALLELDPTSKELALISQTGLDATSLGKLCFPLKGLEYFTSSETTMFDPFTDTEILKGRLSLKDYSSLQDPCLLVVRFGNYVQGMFFLFESGLSSLSRKERNLVFSQVLNILKFCFRDKSGRDNGNLIDTLVYDDLSHNYEIRQWFAKNGGNLLFTVDVREIAEILSSEISFATFEALENRQVMKIKQLFASYLSYVVFKDNKYHFFMNISQEKYSKVVENLFFSQFTELKKSLGITADFAKGILVMSKVEDFLKLLP